MPVVRVGALQPEAVFRTTLTRRVGVVLGPRFRGGVPVYLEPLAGDDVYEEKFLPPEIIVAVDESITPATFQEHAA